MPGRSPPGIDLFDRRVAASLESVAANLDLHEPGLDQNRALNANHRGDPRL